MEMSYLAILIFANGQHLPISIKRMFFFTNFQMQMLLWKTYLTGATYIFFCLVVYNLQFFFVCKTVSIIFSPTQSNSPNARKERKKLLEWLHFKTKIVPTVFRSLYLPSFVFGVLYFTIKPVYNDYPWDPKKVAVVDRWSLFRSHLCSKSSKWDFKTVVDKWLLFGGGR